MKVKDKEKFNNRLKGWQIINSISLMVLSHSAMIDKGVWRTALATQGLLNTQEENNYTKDKTN